MNSELSLKLNQLYEQDFQDLILLSNISYKINITHNKKPHSFGMGCLTNSGSASQYFRKGPF